MKRLIVFLFLRYSSCWGPGDAAWLWSCKACEASKIYPTKGGLEITD